MARMMTGAQLLLAAALLALSAIRSEAATFNVTSAFYSPELVGQNINMSPNEIPAGCTAIGVCVPFKVTLKANTLWYWCGFSSTHRVTYMVNGTNRVTSQIMRIEDLTDCALANLSKTTSCSFIFGSAVSGYNSTVWTTLGMAFPGETCFVVGNNGASSRNITVQVFQYHDSPRYYGTVFTIILTIILLGGVSIYLGYTCYHEITSSPDRIAELKALEQQLNKEASEPADADKAEGTFSDRVKDSLAKVKGLVLRSKHSPA